MVGMPVFIDQKDVLKRMEEKGVGHGVPKGAPADEIHAAIVEVGELGKGSIEKKTFSFGHCPNYLNPPP